MEFTYVPTTCPYCGTGCGLNLVVKDKKVVGVAPWHRNPVNEGKLCPKGNYAYEFINSPDRLTTPLIKKDGKFVEAGWDEAYNLIVSKFKSYKGEEMACLASARVSNEENYLMQKFARAVLKTPHIDHCARLCHSSTVAGLAAVFGSGAMTNSIIDIGESKCVFVIGSNTLEQHPLIGRRIMVAKKNGAKVIVADPRLTPTAKLADLYLPFYSGTDVALMNGMMQHIIKNGLENKEFIEKRTKDFEKLKEVVMKDTYSLDNVAKICGIQAKDIATAAEWIAKAESSNLLYSMGITQHTVGVDNVKSTANLQMLTGHLGKRGGGVCALRGQNNVQGACDMGCLPNVLLRVPAGRKCRPAQEDGICLGLRYRRRQGRLYGHRDDKRSCRQARHPQVHVYHGREPDDLRSRSPPRREGSKNPRIPGCAGYFSHRNRSARRRRSPGFLLCRKDRHPDLDRAPGPDVEEGAGAAGIGKGRLADHLRTRKSDGL